MSDRDGRDTERVGLLGALWQELGRAVQDIRQRVVEEGWFGRITTPLARDHSLAPSNPAERAVSFEDLWPQHSGSAKEPGHEPDRGMDR